MHNSMFMKGHFTTGWISDVQAGWNTPAPHGKLDAHENNAALFKQRYLKQ